MRRLLLICCLLWPALAHAQTTPAPTPQGSPSERSLATLKSIIEPLTTANAELEKLRRELKSRLPRERLKLALHRLAYRSR